MKIYLILKIKNISDREENSMLKFLNRKSEGNILIQKFSYVLNLEFVKTLMEKYDGDDKPLCVIEDVIFFDINNRKLDVDSFVKRKFNDNCDEKQKIDWMVEETELSLIYASTRIKYFVKDHSQETVLEDEDLDIIRRNMGMIKEMDVNTKNKTLLQHRLEMTEKTLKNKPNRPDASELRQERDFLISVLQR